MEGSHRTARFKCALALYHPGGEILTAEGVCEGIIAEIPMGEGGFGYDPIFFLPTMGKTMAQLTPEEKNRISHRGDALRKMGRTLQEFLDRIGE